MSSAIIENQHPREELKFQPPGTYTYPQERSRTPLDGQIKKRGDDKTAPRFTRSELIAARIAAANGEQVEERLRARLEAAGFAVDFFASTH